MQHPASDDAVLLQHLQLANQQLRAVLADAGCSLPELPLPADLQQLQEEEAMPLLAEENYQLRQLLQQLQHQQQLQDLEQQLVLQQELELNRSALEFDRLSPAPELLEAELLQGGSPPLSAAATAEHNGPVGSSPAAGASAAADRAAWASPAQAGNGLSPAAARLVAVPSLNTVQLVEAEAAAQLATQAVIQAEAEAYQHTSWQLQNNHFLQDPPSGLTHSTGLGAARHNERPAGGLTYSQQQQQFDDHNIHPQRLFADEQHARQPAGHSLWRQQQEGQQQQQEQVQLAPQLSSDSGRSSGRSGLPQLPRLALPRSVTGRRSIESTCSDAGRSSVSQPPSACAAASARSIASSSCGGLKQLTSDLLLLPPAVRSSAAATGPDALRETFGDSAHSADYENGARGFGVGHAGAAAGLAADAAAGIWYPPPAAAAAAADGRSSSGQLAGRGEGAVGGLTSPSSRAAGVAADAVRSILYPGAQGGDQAAAAAQQQQQQQQQAGASAGTGAAQPPASAVSKGGLRLPLSVFTGATDAAHASAAGQGDVFSPDQYQRQHPMATASPQQQQQSPQLAAGGGLHMQMPALPPIATRHGGAGGRPPAHSGAAAVSQAAAAAAAAALAGHSFHMQLPPPPQPQLQPLPALRLPPRVQTFEQQQQERRSSSFDSTMSDIPPSQPQQLPALRLPPRVQTFEQQQQERRSSSFDSTRDIPPSLPKLRMPAPRQPAAVAAAAEAIVDPTASLPRLQTQAGPGSYSSGSSPGESPASDSAFFRAGADPVLFDGGSSGLFDAGADMFGARISMDDSGYPLSSSEAQPSQLPDVPEDYFGLPDSTGGGFEGGQGDSSYGASQQSGWLGISYQQQSLRDGRISGWSSAQGSRELFQPLSAAAASAESYGAPGRRRRSLAADTIYEMSELQQEQEEPISRQATWSGSGFVATAAAGSFSSLTSGALSQQVSYQAGISTQPSAAAGGTGAGAAYRSGHPAQQQELERRQQQEQEQLHAFPNLAPLRVTTGRQQDDQTPPLTWQPRPLLHADGSSGAARSNLGRLPSGSAAAAAAAVAATSPAHMAATEAAEEAASVGLAAAATGGMDSLQLQQLLHHLARVAEEASSATAASAAAAAAAFAPVPSRTLSAPAGPPAISTGAGEPRSNGGTPAAARHGMQQPQHQQEQAPQGVQQQQDGVADADCFTPVSRGSGGDQAGAASLPSGPSSRSLSPFAAAAAAAAAASSPARAGAAGGVLVLSPQPSSLQRTLSAGQMGPGAALGLPPKWASRSGSSNNLTALHSQQLASPRRQQQQPVGADDAAAHSQHDLHEHAAAVAAARAVPDRSATAPAPAPPVSLISPRLGLHGGLRVITHAAGAHGGGAYSSNGSVSDADAGSAHTTPMHRPPQGAAAVPRTNSSSSLRPAGLASITVPPSPASSGVRYVPASPRVVGFDCPLTPHAYALRSPSWRSEVGVEGSSVGGGHNAWACGSGSSTPRRQASSPGLLQQALSRSGLGGTALQQHYSQQQFYGQSGAASAAGSGCNTPSSAASAARRAAQLPFGAPGHTAPVAAAGLAVGSHSSPGQMMQKQAGSCSSNALLVTMMGGQLPVLAHHQRTSSSPYLDVLQSPGSARRFRGSSATGLDAAAAAAAAAAGEDAAHAARAPAAAAAAAVLPPAQGRGGRSRSSSSNASSRRSSTDSGAGSSPEQQSGGDDTAAGTAGDGGAAAPAAAAAAANAQPDAAVAGTELALDLPRSVSPQLRVSTCSSQPVSPRLQQVTSPPAHSAQACTEAGQHRLSRFGLAAARASTEKPLAGISCKGAADEAMLPKAPEQGLTAVVMTAGMCEAAAAAGGGSSSGVDPSSSSSRQAQVQPEAPASAAGQGQQHAVAVPDTPALEAASGSTAFAAQQSLEQELPAVEIEGSSAAALIEQELQRALAEEAAAVGVCPAPVQAAGASSGAAHVGPEAAASSSGAAGASSSRQGQRVSWSADTAACPEGGCEHHGPPASPCTPQQDAEQQQQQQQLQSPDRQHDQQPQRDWQQQQQQAAASTEGSSSSPGKDHLLPRSKSAAAYLSTAAAGAAADAAAHGTSEAGTPTADSAAGAGAGSSGVWSPTHDVRGASCRHMRRSPSALLMRLSQKQVDVLAARGRASTAVPYVLPHRSSNPASALRALAAGSTDCSSSGQCTDQGATPVGGTPRTSLELGRSSSTPHAQQAALQGESSWDVEQVQPPENLLAVASSAGAPADVYIPLPPAADAAAGEGQPRQQQAAPAGGAAAVVDADGEAAGPADNREVLLSAAIVQQRLKSTSKWLGPAPVVAASAAAGAAEAEAAAVVSRRRTGQEAAGCVPSSQRASSSCLDGSNRGGSGSKVASTAAALAAAAHADCVEGGLHRASSSGGGRVAMAAAALSAAAEAPREQAGVQRAGSNGSSRVAQAAAALTANRAAAAAAPGLTPVRPARLKAGDAWLADGGRSAAGTVSEPAGTVSDSRPGSRSSSQGPDAPVQQQEEAQQQPQLLQQQPAGCNAQAGSDAAACAAAAGQSQQPSTGPVVVTAAVLVAAAEAPEASVQQDSTTGLVPEAVLVDHCIPSAAASAAANGVGAPQQAASGSAAHQLLQLDGCNDAALSAVRNRQQQLLKQRQLMRQQQQHRKRQEVAAWAAAQRQQHAGTAVLAAAADADAVPQDVGPGSSGGPDQTIIACLAAGAPGAVLCSNPVLPDSLAGVSAGDGLLQHAVLAADAEFAAAAAAEAGDVLGHSSLGLQRCDSLALSVADEFEVQSWAAWSTTSSINKCPKLQWWGNESGQGRFSQRQQRQGGGGGAAQQSRWWQRLLVARQDGSQASRAAAGGAAGPSGL